MKTNEVLRQLQQIFGWSQTQMTQIFSQAERTVAPEQIESWLKEKASPGFTPCEDVDLAAFLNGLIVENRGRKEGSQIPVPEEQITNNMILKKLRIALDLKNEDLLNIYEWAHIDMGTHELSPYFRKPGNKHYRSCPDEVLAQFFDGLAQKHQFESE